MRNETRTVMFLKIGDRVLVNRGFRSPCAGSFGTVIGINFKDRYGVYLVRFDNGLQFRYASNELHHVVTAQPAEPRKIGVA